MTQRLVVKCKPFTSPTVRKSFIERFNKHGIAESRLDLLGLLPGNREHLQAYQLMDLSLDTFPYSGTTTTCEALWMGVPVVTLVGETHAQNVSTSLLTTIGYPEWIAKTPEEYIKIAISLANDVGRLREIRANLRTTMKSSYLCDGEAFVKNLEDVYHTLWEKKVKELIQAERRATKEESPESQ